MGPQAPAGTMPRDGCALRDPRVGWALLATASLLAVAGAAVGASTEATVSNVPPSLDEGGVGRLGSTVAAWAAVADGNGAADVRTVTFSVDTPGTERQLEPDAVRRSGEAVIAATDILFRPDAVDGVSASATDAAGATRSWALGNPAVEPVEDEPVAAPQGAAEPTARPAGDAAVWAAVAGLLLAGAARWRTPP